MSIIADKIYFDKYRMDIDAIKYTATLELRKEISRERDAIEHNVPSPEDIVSLIPSDLLKDVESDSKRAIDWNLLEKYYIESIKHNDYEWKKRETDLNKLIKTIQDKFAEHELDPSTVEREQKHITMDMIIDNPEKIELLDLAETRKMRVEIEQQLESAANTLRAAYKKELKKFLTNWEKFRVERAKIQMERKYKSGKLDQKEVQEKKRIEDQYTLARAHLDKLLPPKPKRMNILFKYQGREEKELIDITIDDLNRRISDFIKKLFNSKQPNYKNSRITLKAYITDGNHEMIDHLYVRNYDINNIDCITIAVSDNED